MKLKSGGRSRPFGSFVLGSRSSSKKQCAQDSTGISLVDGVYSSNLLHKLIASGGVLGLNTCNKKILYRLDSKTKLTEVMFDNYHL